MIGNFHDLFPNLSPHEPSVLSLCNVPSNLFHFYTPYCHGKSNIRCIGFSDINIGFSRKFVMGVVSEFADGEQSQGSVGWEHLFGDLKVTNLFPD